jgi:beta-glucosidase
VTFPLTARDLSYWSPVVEDWVLEAGTFELAVGASSRDLRLTAVVDVEAPPIRPPLGGMSTLEEWLADPDGAAALRDEAGEMAVFLEDPELLKIIGNFPVSTLLTFPGMSLGQEALDRMVAKAGGPVAAG